MKAQHKTVCFCYDFHLIIHLNKLLNVDQQESEKLNCYDMPKP